MGRPPQAYYDQKHRIELTGDTVHPEHSAPYWARSTARQFAATEIDRMLQEEVCEPATTK